MADIHIKYCEDHRNFEIMKEEIWDSKVNLKISLKMEIG